MNLLETLFPTRTFATPKRIIRRVSGRRYQLRGLNGVEARREAKRQWKRRNRQCVNSYTQTYRDRHRDEINARRRTAYALRKLNG